MFWLEPVAGHTPAIGSFIIQEPLTMSIELRRFIMVNINPKTEQRLTPKEAKKLAEEKEAEKAKK